MTVPVIICAGPDRADDGFRCYCCGFEAASFDAFAPGGMCWPCGLGGNPECGRCVDGGVPVDRFSSKQGRSHRLAVPWRRGEDAVAACGYRIPAGDVGGSSGRAACRRCWGEESSG